MDFSKVKSINVEVINFDQHMNSSSYDSKNSGNFSLYLAFLFGFNIPVKVFSLPHVRDGESRMC